VLKRKKDLTFLPPVHEMSPVQKMSLCITLRHLSIFLSSVSCRFCRHAERLDDRALARPIRAGRNLFDLSARYCIMYLFHSRLQKQMLRDVSLIRDSRVQTYHRVFNRKFVLVFIGQFAFSAVLQLLLPSSYLSQEAGVNGDRDRYPHRGVRAASVY